MNEQPAGPVKHPVQSFTAVQLRRIADLIDALDKVDPADSRPSVYPESIRLTSIDGEDLGTIDDPDGLGYFWWPSHGGGASSA